ncbi:N-acetyltransferase [Winogradskya consettensis]|nr:N-acetyltransferase [Actinoplanes consettensis]
MDLDIAPLDGRMGLWEQLSGYWPTFVTNDPTGALYYRHFAEIWPEFTLLAVDRATGEPVAKAHSVPLSFTGDIGDIGDGLPENGWDWAIRSAALDHMGSVKPTIVSALEIMVRPDVRGSGLSGLMLGAMRENAGRLGFKDLVAPVRPSGKHAQIDKSIDEYAYETRADGLPIDPWLRVHVRAGGTILNVAHSSMVVAGSLKQWREWTGLPFDRTGPVVVPEALTAVHCDVEEDHAVYVEPNVWVHHRI